MSFNSSELARTMYRFNSFNVFKQLPGGIFDYMLDEVQEWSFKEVIISLYSIPIMKMWLLLAPMFQDRFDRKQISSIIHTTKFVLTEFDCDFNVPRLSFGVISVCSGWVMVWFHQNFHKKQAEFECDIQYYTMLNYTILYFIILYTIYTTVYHTQTQPPKFRVFVWSGLVGAEW